MIQFKKILVPVDFSEPSKRALRYAQTLAHQFKAQLILAHIVPESAALTYAFPPEAFVIEKEQRDKAVHEIQILVSADEAAKLRVNTIVKIGRIEEELLGIIKDESIDLVVIGTHGRRHLGRWFIGSVAEHMLRRVPVPILTVSRIQREKDAAEPDLVSLKRILYACDLSDSSSVGMKYAVELARQSGAQLTVLHVVEYLNLLYEAAAYVDAERVQRLQEMRERLDEFVASEQTQGIHVETLVTDGKPYEKILAVAEERGMDLIVLNLHSIGVLERAFLGSTAERVVRLAPIPVLSAPVVLN